MAEVTLIYGKISSTFSLPNLTPSEVAKKFNVNLAELFLIDSKQNLINVVNEKFDSVFVHGELYKVYDDFERPRVETDIVIPMSDRHVSSFKNTLQKLASVENIKSSLKLQSLATVTMNAKDISLKPGNYKHINNTKSLRAAVHDLTTAVTKTFLETSNCAGEVHTGLYNILKGVPDMLKEVDSPNSESIETLQSLEKWMTETLEECYGQSEKGAQQTEDLLHHINELEGALIAALETDKTSENELNEEKLELLKRQQKRYEQAKLEAKQEIDNAWQTKKLDENAEEEYDTARRRRNEKIREISELELQIEQEKKSKATNEDVLKILRKCIAEISEVKENWINASSLISDLKNKLEVEKKGKRWENATKSLKIDLNKRFLIENMMQFLAVGYKVDFWMNLQNQMIKEHLLPLASSATNLFGGNQIVTVANDVPQIIKQANDLLERKQSETITEYASDLRECLSLHSVATIFQSDSDCYKM